MSFACTVTLGAGSLWSVVTLPAIAPRPACATRAAAERSITKTRETCLTVAILLHPAQDEAFQVIGLRHPEEDGMIAALHAFFDDRHRRVAVDRCLVNNRRKHLLVDVVRTAARYKVPARIQQPHRPEVDLLVTSDRIRNRRLVLGERRRVENDGVVARTGTLEPPQLVEDVDLARLQVRHAVPNGVAADAGHRIRGDVERLRFRTGACEP